MSPDLNVHAYICIRSVIQYSEGKTQCLIAPKRKWLSSEEVGSTAVAQYFSIGGLCNSN